MRITHTPAIRSSETANRPVCDTGWITGRPTAMAQPGLVGTTQCLTFNTKRYTIKASPHLGLRFPEKIKNARKEMSNVRN